jgi:hypothetical protein
MKSLPDPPCFAQIFGDLSELGAGELPHPMEMATEIRYFIDIIYIYI